MTTEQEKRADALEKGLAFYRAVLSLNGQGVSRPIPLRLSQMIQLLFNEEGRRAVLAVTRSLQTAQPQARPAETGKSQGTSQRQQRQALREQSETLPQKLDLSGSQVTEARAARVLARQQKQAVVNLTKSLKKSAAAGSFTAEQLTSADFSQIKKAGVTADEVTSADFSALKEPSVTAADLLRNTPLTDTELSEIATNQVGGAAIIKEYGEARVLATLKDFEVPEIETAGKSANQLGNLLKKKLKEWEG